MSQQPFISIRHLIILPAAGLLTGVAYAQIGAKPICNYDIQENREHANDSGSGSTCSYSICTTGWECIEGNKYKSCGTAVTDMWAYCENYVGGTWNNTTGQCEGGYISGPYTFSGEVVGFPYPVFCSSGQQ